jgi:hypothetical protein
MKIHSVGAELFHSNRQMDRHDEDIHCFQNFVNVPKNGSEMVKKADARKRVSKAFQANRKNFWQGVLP